jgi:hypothetical protein
MEYADRQAYRLAAAECLEVAQSTGEARTRERLTALASKFLALAGGPGGSAVFETVMDEFNKTQMRE